MSASGSNPQKGRVSAEQTRDTGYSVAHGFLLANDSQNLIFANSDAVSILSYPGPITQDVVGIFERRIRPLLVSAGPVPSTQNGHSLIKFKSGRRTYICQVFLLTGGGKSAKEKLTLLMLERGTSKRLALCQVAEQYHLTHREQQAVALLLQGLTNKEMAESMGVSANTVKAFLRIATVRMGVSSRSGIITKILEALSSL